jgi:hypothetical protein
MANVMRFYLGKELNNDPTNFWAANTNVPQTHAGGDRFSPHRDRAQHIFRSRRQQTFRLRIEVRLSALFGAAPSRTSAKP